MLKALIVDDEWPARRELRAQLERFKGVQVVGEAATATEALVLIQALDYHVVFLDIQMPGMSGLELARRLQQKPRRPWVVFTTAYPQYAIDAVNVGAVGYLLKPFENQTLVRVLRRVMELAATAAPGRPGDAGGASDGTSPPAAGASRGPFSTPLVGVPGWNGYLRVPAEKGGRIVLLAPAEIVYAAARDDKTYLKTAAERLLCRLTLRELQERLAPFGFLRVHRRYLVNLEKVREVVTYFKGSLALVMADPDRTEVPVSRTLAPAVKGRLGLKNVPWR